MMPRQFFFAVSFIVLALPLSGCNTMEGMKRDIKAVSDAITGTSGPKGYYSQNSR